VAAHRRDRRARPRRDGAGRGEVERLDGIHPVREALRARRRELLGLRVLAGPRRPEIEELCALAVSGGVAVTEVDEIRGAGDANPQGVMLEAGPLPEVALEALLCEGSGKRLLVALDGVEDPQNVGSIARVAEAAGASGLLLTQRRSARIGPAAARASAGAIEWLPIVRVPNLGRALEATKREGFWIFGAELGAPHSLFELPDRWIGGDAVVVLGAEGRGLRPGISKQIDFRVEIPMFGQVASLNVATASAVILFELRRRILLAARP
jgi:23S rRNA (guanosine2251-2'-O)-methyltransferase